jgi:hypothetical protein
MRLSTVQGDPMTDHPDKGKRRGVMPCDNCGEQVDVRVAGQGLLYYICDNKKGGCGYQSFARTKDADIILAKRIAKWDDPAQRRAYLGEDALPAKARAPKPEPDPVEDPPEPDAAEDPAVRNPNPPVPVARAKPARRAPNPKPSAKSPPRKSAFDDLW